MSSRVPPCGCVSKGGVSSDCVPAQPTWLLTSLTPVRARGYTGCRSPAGVKPTLWWGLKMVALSLGGFSEAAPPVPIPNTEVKRLSADDTAFVRVWENRSLPGGFVLVETKVRNQHLVGA